MVTVKNLRGTTQTERRSAIDLALAQKKSAPSQNFYVVEETTSIGSTEYHVEQIKPRLTFAMKVILILED